MNSKIVYRDFCDSDVDAVAQMWKESRSGWPPGFLGASDITASSVAQEEKSSGKLFTVLAFLEERVVGYCRTSPYGGETDASYVDLVNVTPDMHGMGVGKALLLDAVNRSVDFGMNRIDLHTWSSNMKAVPLYKKTGFFWVPETRVYMQNYIPYLLGRDEFLKFLDGEDWYKCFHRALLVEPDVEKTESGREIFRYVFKRGTDSFVAEFDKKGRCPSKVEYPGFSAGLSVDSASEFFVGRPYSVSFTGSGFDGDKVSSDSGESLRHSIVSADTFAAEPMTVRIPRTPYEPADRLTVSLSDSGFELGIGMVGVEEVALHSHMVRFVSPGLKRIRLGLKKLGSVSSVVVSYAVDSGEFYSRVVSLNSDIYQSCVVDLPGMEAGIHTLSVKVGESGYMETIVLVVGAYFGRPVAFDTRSAAVIVAGDRALVVYRRGGYGMLMGRSADDVPQRLSSFCIGAGPPSVWNSDLVKQIYDLELDIENGEVAARTVWPSRPGLTHKASFRMDSAGYAETVAEIKNGSDVAQKVFFQMHGRPGGRVYEPRAVLIPLADGLLSEPGVANHIPDWEEDIPGKVSELGAPWTGITGNGMSMMNYFPGWTKMQFGIPGTEETDVASGETCISPVFRMLCTEGGVKNLMIRAEGLGWNTGNWKEKVPFLHHDLQPVMAEGTDVTLAHPLRGERDGRISVSGEVVGAGRISSSVPVSGVLTGDGAVDVTLSIAERDTILPVYLVNSSRSVQSRRNDSSTLVLSSGRLEVLMDPSVYGHVYSVKLDGVQYILSSHPEPSEFGWEKPWYGGILPRLMGRGNNHFQMENEKPEVSEYQQEAGGLTERGWQMVWTINHKDYGSLVVNWRVGVVPGVPLLRTSLECVASSGDYLDGGMDIRGFIQPGGSVDDGVLTCEQLPGLSQGRKHAGAWASAGKWARVQREGSFVEVYSHGDGVFYSEDYSKEGCHFSVSSKHNKKRALKAQWLFGAVEEDQILASVLRAHR
ncbi:MAG: GNAT family N-acetyltransferase [Candidatus Sabulitectum sp.]|nr:GNAT family N-acetyltransferase [Candidatus Sabulitectum sp.]